jgi:hypothetical protein
MFRIEAIRDNRLGPTKIGSLDVYEVRASTLASNAILTGLRTGVRCETGGRPSYLLDGCLKIPPHKRTVQFVLLSDRDMANQFARTVQNSIRVVQQCAAVETEVHVVAVSHDVAKAVLEWFAGKRESDCYCITFGDGFDRVGCLLKNHFAQGQCQV